MPEYALLFTFTTLFTLKAIKFFFCMINLIINTYLCEIIYNVVRVLDTYKMPYRYEKIASSHSDPEIMRISQLTRNAQIQPDLLYILTL